MRRIWISAPSPKRARSIGNNAENSSPGLKSGSKWGWTPFGCALRPEGPHSSTSSSQTPKIPVQREKPPFQSTASPGTVRIYEGSLSSGFKLWSEHLIIITDEEFLGTRQTAKPRSKSKIEAYVSSFEDLNPGDLVVHTDHGIGRYRGLVQMDVGPSLGEFLFIEYEGNDRLYIPIYRLKAIQKYAGVDGRDPKLDRLGGKSWARIKKRVKQSVEKIAAELVQVYAARSVRKGHRFSKESLELADFEETFEFEETPDQAKAIREVFADMEGEGPMDRLVCGDVGYGKTEVALRASYKAILDGKQVCYLVPTTVLAEQHLKSFKERFAPYPVRVESLSRFKSSGEQRKVIEGLARGTVDIVIGTHRLLQKDVLFRDLGLLIIDEEHRFGVSHKEKIKQLKKLVDVLTLTATPIPRTLQMSLMGIRDLTTIETPPKERLSIKTYLAKYDDEVVKDAISRELRRGGQIFFVHNQVKTIENMADHIRSLTPQARVGVGHGQLKEAELEKAMMAFINREIDVLVCSTIIESGLDIPAANTHHHQSSRPLRPRPNLPAPRPNGTKQRAGLCLFVGSKRNRHEQRSAEEAESTDGFHGTRLRFQNRFSRSSNPRGRRNIGCLSVRTHSGRRIRDVSRVDGKKPFQS